VKDDGTHDQSRRTWARESALARLGTGPAGRGSDLGVIVRSDDVQRGVGGMLDHQRSCVDPYYRDGLGPVTRSSLGVRGRAGGQAPSRAPSTTTYRLAFRAT